MPEAGHRLLPFWCNPRQAQDLPLELGVLKKQLAEQGVNNRGWRLYLDYGDAIFSPLGLPWICPDMPYICAPNALAYLCLLQACEMDVLPPPDLVASMPLWGIPQDRLSAIPPLFFRAAWKASVANQYEQRESAAFIRELVMLCQWFFASGTYITADSTLLKAGWSALLRRHQAWQLERAPAPLPGVDEWNPFVRRVEWGQYRFEALTNSAQLKAEGEAMQHCVATYDEPCLADENRVFSVRHRKTGQRIATLSLFCEVLDGQHHWSLEQLQGVKNAALEQTDLWIATDAVLRAFLDLPASAFRKPVIAKTQKESQEAWCCDF